MGKAIDCFGKISYICDVCNERSDEMQEPGDIDDVMDYTYDVDIKMMKYNVN